MYQKSQNSLKNSAHELSTLYTLNEKLALSTETTPVGTG